VEMQGSFGGDEGLFLRMYLKCHQLPSLDPRQSRTVHPIGHHYIRLSLQGVAKCRSVLQCVAVADLYGY